MADSEREKEGIKVPASLSLRKTYSVKARLDEGCSWTACMVGFIVMLIIGGQNNSSGIYSLCCWMNSTPTAARLGRFLCFFQYFTWNKIFRTAFFSTGNAAIGRNKNNTFLSDYRSGILLHTGEWENWNPSEPMPNRWVNALLYVIVSLNSCFY